MATLAGLNPGRVMLGVGTGESMNEVPVTGISWPPFKERFARLKEAIEIMRQLWREDFVTFEGEYLKTRAATIYDRPPQPVPLYVAASGAVAAERAGRVGAALLATATIGVTALLWVRRARYFPLRVEGESMRPGLPPGSRAAATPVGDGSRLRVGSVVTALRPDRRWVEAVKRIAAGPGDSVTLPDGGAYVLQADEYFLVGDDLAMSTDSRHFGPVRRADITALLHWRYWPWPPHKL